jgi:7-cyano-7-deazaguanine synthase
MANAVVLLSGGLDSVTTLALAISRGYSVTCLVFNYGQRHCSEVNAAKDYARRYGASVIEVAIDLRVFGRSALTSGFDLPQDRTIADMNSGIPTTYVPARNTIFLSYALAVAEVTEANDIFIGVNALDFSGYPDCRPEYITAFQAMARLATARAVGFQGTVQIQAPLIELSKADIIKLGYRLGVDYSETVSCYQAAANGRACGRCDACILRRQGFEQNGFPDPTRYVQTEAVG